MSWRLGTGRKKYLFLRPYFRTVDGERRAYRALFESVRTACGLRLTGGGLSGQYRGSRVDGSPAGSVTHADTGSAAADD